MTTTSQHILVVEDDEMVQAFLALHLEIEGYTVTLAGNGREMTKVLTGGHPDLILLDLNLPDGDGLSLAQKVREFSSIPIIIATARKSQEDRLLGLGVGADDYLTKPFDPKELILRVRNLLERSKAAPDTPPNPTTASEGKVLPPAIWPDEEKKSPSSLSIIQLSLATFFVTAAIAGFWLLAPGNETVQQLSTPAPFSPIQVNPSLRDVAKNATKDTIHAVASRSAKPAAKKPDTNTEVIPPEEEPIVHSRAELLGYGWVTRTKCHPLPRVQWWKNNSHESIAGYVQRKHGGDWKPYQKKWLVRLATIQDIFERDSTAITRTGVTLRGDPLKNYIEQMQKRLAIINCLAKESRQAHGKRATRAASLAG